MTSGERIDRQAAGLPIDRLPVLGGYLTTDFQFLEFAECSAEEFWADPKGMALRAYRNMGVDGMPCMILPVAPKDYRGGVSEETLEERRRSYPTPESVLGYVQELPAPETLADSFDADAYYERVVETMQAGQEFYGEMVNMPARWDIDGSFMWYGTFGYESYLGALGAYPDEMRKLFEYSAERSRLQNEVLARAYTDRGFCTVMLMGQDICGSSGPMVSPKWLKEVYFALGKHAVKPLLDADFKLIWHSDGHILPILDLILELGVSGFQGFQSEHGTTIDIVSKHRTIRGEKFMYFGGISASHTLVYGTPDDVRREIEHYLEVSEGRLFLFGNNTINPDAKLANIRAAYDYAREHPF